MSKVVFTKKYIATCPQESLGLVGTHTQSEARINKATTIFLDSQGDILPGSIHMHKRNQCSPKTHHKFKTYSTPHPPGQTEPVLSPAPANTRQETIVSNN
jgi:hypothetical protein